MTDDYLEIARQALERHRAQQVSSDRPPFPHCPSCASYDLYRKDNTGNYECQNCGMRDITEETARRLV